MEDQKYRDEEDLPEKLDSFKSKQSSRNPRWMVWVFCFCVCYVTESGARPQAALDHMSMIVCVRVGVCCIWQLCVRDGGERERASMFKCTRPGF